MIKYLLSLYVTINGSCYPDRVLMWGNSREIHIVSSTLNIHAKIRKHGAQADYTYYHSNDTLYAVKMNYSHSIYIDIQATKMENTKLIPLYGVILNSNPCK